MKLAEQIPEDVEFTNPRKLLFPRDGFTKSDVISYYWRIADRMLPYLRGRAITVRRFPDGIGEDGFFQKNATDDMPDFIQTKEIATADDTMQAILVNEAAELVWLANKGAIEFHAALAMAETPNHPDQIIFDLDAASDEFSKIQQVAEALRAWCTENDIRPFVKSTGSRGLHVHIPIKDIQNGDFDTIRACAKRIAQHVVDEYPDIATLEQRKENRGDRVYIDVQRNGYNQTAIAPYSLRARKGAPVATPLDWERAVQLETSGNRYKLNTLFKRLSQTEDPWKDFVPHAVQRGAFGLTF